MKNILVISDTHGLVAEDILAFAKKVDEVWHAGDWLTLDLADKLGKICTVRGVWGNIDNPTIQRVFPENNIFTIENLKVMIRHIAGYPKRYDKITKTLITSHRPDIVIAGHSHILKVIRDLEYHHLHINPGSAGISGFHKVRTMIRFKIDNGRIFDMEVIESPKKALKNV